MRTITFLAGILALSSACAHADTLLVLNKADNELAFVDPETMKVTGKLPTGIGPHEVAVSHDGKLAFVANYGDQQNIGTSLMIVDLAEKKILKTHDLSPLKRPHGLAPDNAGRVYFSAELNAAVGRFNPAEDKVDWIGGTGQALSHMVVRDSKSGKLYTSNLLANTVTMLDPKGPPKPTHVKVKEKPEGIAVSPDGKSLWVGMNGTGEICVIDTAKMEITQTIDTGGVPIRVYFTPDGAHVLASDAANDRVLIFDAATFKEIAAVEVGKTPVGIVITPDNKRAYVATTGDGRVSCIDLQSKQVTGTVATGNAPDGVAWVIASPKN